MADVILILAGAKEKIPVLTYRQLGFCHDADELYIGGKSGNKLIGAAAWGEDIKTLKTNFEALDKSKLSANQAEEVETLTEEADLAAVIMTLNALIAGLQTAGIMKAEVEEEPTEEETT